MRRVWYRGRNQALGILKENMEFLHFAGVITLHRCDQRKKCGHRLLVIIMGGFNGFRKTGLTGFTLFSRRCIGYRYTPLASRILLSADMPTTDARTERFGIDAEMFRGLGDGQIRHDTPPGH